MWFISVITSRWVVLSSNIMPRHFLVNILRLLSTNVLSSLFSLFFEKVLQIGYIWRVTVVFNSLVSPTFKRPNITEKVLGCSDSMFNLALPEGGSAGKLKFRSIYDIQSTLRIYMKNTKCSDQHPYRQEWQIIFWKINWLAHMKWWEDTVLRTVLRGTLEKSN